MWKVFFVVSLALLLSASKLALAQKLTIPEQLAREGVDLGSLSFTPSGPTSEFDTVLSVTDVIVRGTVGEPRAYLSDDQMTVFSDYPINKPVVLFDTVAGLSPTPGPADPRIVVTLEGGRVTIGGLNFTVRNQALPSLPSNVECLLLLTRSKDRLYVAGGHYGAFEIKEGRLTPLTTRTNFAPAYRGLLAPVAIDSIVQRRHSLGR